MAKTFISQLNWRSATKEYSSKKVPKAKLNKILESIRLAPTSYNLQPFHVFVIQKDSLLKKIQPIADDQKLVSEADALLVFCARTDISKRADEYVKALAKGDKEKLAKMKRFKQNVRKDFAHMTKEQKQAWATHQVYLAMGFALAACAELSIDSTPMEGFEPKELDKLLKLPSSMKSSALLAIGYRKSDPKRKKFRLSKDDIFTIL